RGAAPPAETGTSERNDRQGLPGIREVLFAVYTSELPTLIRLSLLRLDDGPIRASRAPGDRSGRADETRARGVAPGPANEGDRTRISGLGGSGSSALLQQMRERMMSRLDTDGDGAISQAEFTAGRPQGASEADAAQRFAAIDTDGDGSLTASELSAHFQ